MWKSRSCVIALLLITVMSQNQVEADDNNNNNNDNNIDESTSSPPRLTAHDIQEIKDFVESVRQCRNIPGISLSITEGKESILETGFGLADIENNVKVTADTLFPIASNTKAFTATLLAMLIAEQRNASSADEGDDPPKR